METLENINFIKTLLPFIGVIFIIALGVALLTQQFRKNLYLQKLEQEKSESQHQIELMRSSIQAQEDERKRIARDLHDELGAVLSILRMHLIQFETQLDPSLHNKTKNMRELTETAMSNMRRISHELMPPQLEMFGLVSSLDEVVRQINTTEKLKVTLTSNGNLNELKWDAKLGLYRICLELLNNGIKHAQASQIDLTIYLEGQTIICNYQDNGIGFKENQGKGIGLKSIEGRVKSLSGQFMLGNSVLSGFSLHISIPL